jgi:hypothetical protein
VLRVCGKSQTATKVIQIVHLYRLEMGLPLWVLCFTCSLPSWVTFTSTWATTELLHAAVLSGECCFDILRDLQSHNIPWIFRAETVKPLQILSPSARSAQFIIIGQNTPRNSFGKKMPETILAWFTPEANASGMPNNRRTYLLHSFVKADLWKFTPELGAITPELRQLRRNCG